MKLTIGRTVLRENHNKEEQNDSMTALQAVSGILTLGNNPKTLSSSTSAHGSSVSPPVRKVSRVSNYLRSLLTYAVANEPRGAGDKGDKARGRVFARYDGEVVLAAGHKGRVGKSGLYLIVQSSCAPQTSLTE